MEWREVAPGVHFPVAGDGDLISKVKTILSARTARDVEAGVQPVQVVVMCDGQGEARRIGELAVKALLGARTSVDVASPAYVVAHLQGSEG